MGEVQEYINKIKQCEKRKLKNNKPVFNKIASGYSLAGLLAGSVLVYGELLFLHVYIFYQGLLDNIHLLGLILKQYFVKLLFDWLWFCRF